MFVLTFYACVFKYIVDSWSFNLKPVFFENCRWINVSLNICKPWLKHLFFLGLKKSWINTQLLVFNFLFLARFSSSLLNTLKESKKSSLQNRQPRRVLKIEFSLLQNIYKPKNVLQVSNKSLKKNLYQGYNTRKVNCNCIYSAYILKLILSGRNL